MQVADVSSHGREGLIEFLLSGTSDWLISTVFHELRANTTSGFLMVLYHPSIDGDCDHGLLVEALGWTLPSGLLNSGSMVSGSGWSDRLFEGTNSDG